jgi:hypothetical protein
VGALSGVHIQLLLEFLEEAGHEMDVLEHDPVALLVSDLKLVEGDHILTLTQGDLMQVLVGVDTVLPREALDVLDGVGSWREDEEDGGGGGRVCVGLVQDHEEGAGGVAVHVVVTVREGLSNEHIESGRDTIGSQTSDDQQLLEELLLKSLPVKWKLNTFRGKLIVPFSESVRSLFLKILSKQFESFNFNEFHD